MIESVKEQWLTALRSGEYEQAQGTLYEDGGYCCLGVLCDIAVKNDAIPEPTDFPYPRWDGVIRTDVTRRAYMAEKMVLPAAVAEWAGLTDVDPMVNVPEEDYDTELVVSVEKHLSELNDDGSTFAELADLIEAQL
ncbi:hypothetical protein O7635_29655 [Asanoa sp. WMMD1127]|uniref:hypothetical protein n=1 Tax=Asanoa sp. WMMD1127 TaxID=3016107 RepID=UPI002417193A|nr:hypothetical protein [Asanoa sp. WMMD1127]MDG4826035.1 hypothetical protein [Asanoa sp. WMMD1127]